MCAPHVINSTEYALDEELYLFLCRLAWSLFYKWIHGLHFRKSFEEIISCCCQVSHLSIGVQSIQYRAFRWKHLIYVFIVSSIIQMWWGQETWCPLSFSKRINNVIDNAVIRSRNSLLHLQRFRNLSGVYEYDIYKFWYSGTGLPNYF